MKVKTKLIFAGINLAILGAMKLYLNKKCFKGAEDYLAEKADEEAIKIRNQA